MTEPTPDVEVTDWQDLMGITDIVRVQLKPWMTEKNFVLVDSVEQLSDIVDEAIAAGTCALDLETSGLDSRIWPDDTKVPKGRTFDQIVGYCLSYDGDTGYYVPVGHESKEHNIDWDGAVQEIKRLCENTVTVYHNATFDHEFLYGVGIDIVQSDMFEDTLILDYLRDSSDKKHGLKKLSSDYLQMEMIELKELFHEKEKDRNFSKLDPTQEGVVHYAASDAICTYLLLQFYKTHAYRPLPKSGENNESHFQVVPESDLKRTIYGEQSLTYKVEKMCVPAIRWMERNRPKIDLDYLARVRTQVHGLIEDTKRKIAEGFQQRGVAFTPEDVSSAQRLGRALEELHSTGHLRVQLQKTELSEQVQTDEAAMDLLVAKVGEQLPFLKLISTFRKLQKVDGTYLKPLQENTDGYLPSRETNKHHKMQDSSIRFSFQANRVDTGRFAASKGRPDYGYSGINVQSMPAGYNVGKFSAKKIISRPDGEGDTSVPIYENLREAIEDGQGFLIWVYDGHFVRDPLKDNQEYCVRSSCEGCPFAAECQYEEVPLDDDGNPKRNTKILSLDSSARPAIVARDGYVIAAIDQSGVELRVAASISQEPKWIDEFFQCSSCGEKFPGPTMVSPEDTPIPRRKWKIETPPPPFCTNCGSDKLGDLHTLTTKIVYGDDVVDRPDFKQYRQNSKGANFAILYGGGPGAVARSTGVHKNEGKIIRDKFLAGLPRLNTWFKEVSHRANRNYEVTTGFGRKIRLPDITHTESWIQAKAERNAVNSIIQGTATGDLTKFSMGMIFKWLHDNDRLDDARLMLTIHDELVFEVKKSAMDELFPVIVDKMTEWADRAGWPVPLRCDIEFGQNFQVAYDWGQIHTINPETGRAFEPVPKFLWNQIEMQPGMWYVDNEGNETVVPMPDKPDEPEEVPEAEVSEVGVPEAEVPEAEVGANGEVPEMQQPPAKEQKVPESDLREGFLNHRKPKPKDRALPTGPIFHFQLIPGGGNPGLLGNDDSTLINFFYRRLFNILDFLGNEEDSNYILKITDSRGYSVIDITDRRMVDPEKFMFLAKFCGILGVEAE